MQGRFEKEANLSLNIHPYGYAEPHHQKRARTTLAWNTQSANTGVLYIPWPNNRGVGVV
jgi:hypothetical protein